LPDAPFTGEAVGLFSSYYSRVAKFEMLRTYLGKDNRRFLDFDDLAGALKELSST
jgi:hypothetical protein